MNIVNHPDPSFQGQIKPPPGCTQENNFFCFNEILSVKKNCRNTPFL
jgi:hypothetical protein